MTRKSLTFSRNGGMYSAIQKASFNDNVQILLWTFRRRVITEEMKRDQKFNIDRRRCFSSLNPLCAKLACFPSLRTWTRKAHTSVLTIQSLIYRTENGRQTETWERGRQQRGTENTADVWNSSREMLYSPIRRTILWSCSNLSTSPAVVHSSPGRCIVLGKEMFLGYTECTDGFCQRGRGTAVNVEGPKTEKAYWVSDCRQSHSLRLPETVLFPVPVVVFPHTKPLVSTGRKEVRPDD